MATRPFKSRLIAGSAVAALAVATIGGFEGLRLIPYRDVGGVPTACFGETRGIKLTDRYTVAQCQALLGHALTDYERGMAGCLRDPAKIPDKSYVAFLSLTYNIGVGAFCHSTVARRLNAGDLKGACDAMLAWSRAGGRQVAGLARRRREERALCLEGAG